MVLSKRFKADGNPAIDLNSVQMHERQTVWWKIVEHKYTPILKECCICKRSQFEILSEKERYGFPITHSICTHCGLVQIRAPFDKESYADFYVNSYRKLYLGKESPGESYFKLQYEDGETIIRLLEDKLGGEITRLKVLEIGSGAGGILKAFEDHHNTVYGCDLDRQYVNYGRADHSVNIVYGTIDTIDKTYKPDIIIYSQVLEHIVDLKPELQKLRSFCDENTIIYIAVPGVKLLSANYNCDFLQYLHIAHVYHFTLTTLTNLLNQNGFAVIYGDEKIDCICKISDDVMNLKYVSDYENTMVFLHRVEWLHYFPLPAWIQTHIKPRVGKVLRFLKCMK